MSAISSIARWYRTTDGARWLEVVVSSRVAGYTDGYATLDAMGIGSWTFGDRAYLTELDAETFLNAENHDEGDIPTVWRNRAPDGYRIARDPGAVAVDPNASADEQNVYYASLEQGRW